jgi:hypothetical protein
MVFDFISHCERLFFALTKVSKNNFENKKLNYIHWLPSWPSK